MVDRQILREESAQAAFFAKLDALAERIGPNSDGRFRCPTCSDTRRKNRNEPCLQVTTDDIGYKWNCWHCDDSEELKSGRRAIWGKPQGRKAPPPPRRIVEVFAYEANDREAAHRWGAGRGLSSATIDAFDISVVPKKGMVWEGRHDWALAFPHWFDGRVVNVKYRGDDKDFRQEKDALQVPYGWQRFDPAENEVTFVEGEPDVLALYEAGICNVLSPPSGAGSVNVDWLLPVADVIDKVENVTLWLDNDKRGYALRDALIARFSDRYEKIRIVTPLEDCKDANDVLVRHGAEAVRTAMFRARYAPIIGEGSFSDYIDEAYASEVDGGEKGVKTGYPSLDNLMTFLPGELQVWTGIPSHGKTSFANQCLVNAARIENAKSVVASFEMLPKRLLSRLIKSTAQETIVDAIGRMPKDIYKRWAECVAEYIKPVRCDDIELTVDAVLETIAKIVRRHAAQIVVIDPYNCFDHKRGMSMTETEYVSWFCSKLKRFATQHHCCVVIIAHPRKMDPGTRPTMYDISGSANWYAKADIGVCVYRDDEAGNTVVEVLKNRETGMRGEVRFRFDKSIETFYEIPDAA